MDGPDADLLDGQLAELDSVLERLLADVEGLGPGSPRPSVDSTELAGSSGQAQENRTIYRSHALAAGERARLAREPLAELAQRVRDGLEQSRRSRRRVHDARTADTAAAGRDARSAPADQLRAAMAAVVGGDPDAVVSSLSVAVIGFSGVAHSTVCLRDHDGVPRHTTASDDVGNALAEIQGRVGQGPCVDAARTGRAVEVRDMCSPDAPWPMFGAAAAGLGVTGVVAVPLRTRTHTGADPDTGTGSLTLWTTRADAVTESLVALAEVFARYGGLAVAVAQRRSRPACGRSTSPGSPGGSGKPDRPEGRDEYAHLAPVLRELATLSADDPRRTALREELVRGYHPVVEHIALRFRDRGEPLDDLRQAGAVGLVNAVDRFDPDHGTDFLGYAVPTITGEIRRHFRDRTWSVHVPRRQKDTYVRLTEAQRELATTLQRAPRVSELAGHLELSRDEVIDALAAQQAYSAQSIDAPAGGSESDGADGAGSARAEWAADLAELDGGLDAVEARETLRPLLAALPERERLILMLRFFGNQTQTQIADRIGVSQMQVSRILSRTLATLRAQAQPHGDGPGPDAATTRRPSTGA